ncbi:MAG: DNA repair protein RecO [Kofleriaceae bacterium]
MADGSLGVVLKTTPLRESDLLVSLYTDTHGRVSAVARGARRSKVRFAGTLSLLVLARYQLGRPPRGELWSLEGGEMVREWVHLASDVVAVAHASYVAELLGAIMPPETPEPEALEVILAVWDCLAEGGPSPGALRAAEMTLLELAGHAPAIDRCAACGSTELDGGAVFDATRGGAICRGCAGGSRSAGVRPFEPETRAYLSAIGTLGTPGAARAVDGDARFSPADRAAGRDAMLSMISSLVDKPLRSLEYIAKLGAAAARRPT